MSDENATGSVETRYFTGTIPYEILIRIIELSDLGPLIKCQLLNRSTYQLISLFSNQVVDSVASRESYYKHRLFTQDRPKRLTIAYLRHIAMAHKFCREISMKHFELNVVGDIQLDTVCSEQQRNIDRFRTTP
jgi:hypothetical protein